MKRLFLPTIFVLICLCSNAQNGNFIFLTSTGKLYSVNVDSKADTFGVPQPITILPKKTPYTKAFSIALNKDSIYLSESNGTLWSGYYNKSTLTVTINPKSIYKFPNTKSYGLTVDSKGIIYAGDGTFVDIYDPSLPANKQPASIVLKNNKGTLWSCGGDMIFWGGNLYETVENAAATIQGIIKINLTKGATQDTLFSFDPNKKIFGISSVNVPCKNNQTFALSDDGNVYPIDLYTNTLSPTPFTDNTYTTNTIVKYLGGNFTIYDAASVAEGGVAQRPTPPANPVTPNNICIGQPFAFSVGINDPTNDVLHWFTPPNIPPSNNNFSLTTPIVDVNKVGSTKYLITEFNNSNGCESDTVSIVVNVHPYPTKPVITASVDTVCNASASTLTITTASQTSGASYQWANALGNVGTNSTTYSATATNAYAVKATAFGCSTASDSVKIKVLNSNIIYSGNPFCNNGTASVTQTGDNEGGVYSASSSDLILDSKTGQLDLAKSKPGTYTVTYTLNGTAYTCPYTTSVTINASSTSSNMASICQGGSYTFNGTTYTTAGTYTAKLTNSKGCDSVATLVLSVKQPTSSTTSITICPAGLPYTWNGQSYAAAGTFLVHLTNNDGCDSAATLVLSVTPTLTSTTNISVCSLPYNWNGTAYTAVGTYTFKTNSSAGCDSIATLVLSLKAGTSSTTNMSICPSSLPYTWNGATYSTIGTYIAHLTNSEGCDSAATLVLSLKAGTTSTTPVSICANSFPYTWNGIAYNTAGTYTIHLTNSIGCDSAATLVLSVTPKASVDAITGPSAVELHQSIDLDDATTGGVWSITPTTVATIDNNGKVTGVALGTATVSYTIPSATCGSDTAYHTITVSSQEVFIPNLFSPNGDKNGNDVFYVRGIGAAYSNVSLTIFDSWGNKIFDAPNGKLNDATVGWKGDYKNKPQPPGAYVYVVKLTLPTGGTVTKKGIINLIR